MVADVELFFLTEGLAVPANIRQTHHTRPEYLASFGSTSEGRGQFLLKFRESPSSVAVVIPRREVAETSSDSCARRQSDLENMEMNDGGTYCQSSSVLIDGLGDRNEENHTLISKELKGISLSTWHLLSK